MNYILMFLTLAVTLFALLKNVRWGVCAAVALLVLMPRYLVIPLGHILIPGRELILLILCLFCVMWTMQNRRILNLFATRFQEVKYLFGLTLTFILLNVISSYQGGTTANWSYISLGYDILNSIGILFLMLIISQHNNAIHNLIFALVIGLLISEILAVVEFQLGHTLLAGFLNSHDVSGTELFTDRSRDNTYRVRAMFDNHLMFSEYVLIAWPLAWVLYLNSAKGFEKKIARVSLMLVPLVLLYAGARSAWLIFIVEVSILVILKRKKKFHSYLKVILYVIVFMMIMLVASEVIKVINSPQEYFLAGDSAANSSIERAMQYQLSVNLFLQQPWLGYGKGAFLGSNSIMTYVDSYFLVVLLECGVLGMILFLLIFTVVAKNARSLINLSKSCDKELNIAIALMIALIPIFLEQFFISIDWNNIYLYLIEGMIIGQLARIRSIKV